MLAALAALSVLPPAAAAQPRPNVVLIIMDDLGYGDLGSYGVPDAKTPNLDRLAREGVRLTDSYANAPNCSPTRTGLISGRYQQRYGIEQPIPMGNTDIGLLPSEHSLPRLLKTEGYTTGRTRRSREADVGAVSQRRARDLRRLPRRRHHAARQALPGRGARRQGHRRDSLAA